MKINDAAWILIRSVGLLMLICSFYFGVRVALLGAMTYSLHKYTSLTVGSSLPIPKDKDWNDPQNRIKQQHYQQYFSSTVFSGVWLIFLMGSGLYLLKGGRYFHKLITSIPDGEQCTEQNAAEQPATRLQSKPK
ncbi:MAG: hypothetical protein L3J39_19485 [Verrucomicrobiales bacterium]|nr:hypothetical protein [Verrucomicrobiales bacterium]